MVFIIAVILFAVTEQWFWAKVERSDSAAMTAAASRAARWMNIIADRKRDLGIYSDQGGARYSALLGDEYSDFTTTLGSIEAKTTAANPEFAALFVRMLNDAGIDSSRTVGVTLSGSFPSLSLNLLAALQTIGAKAVIFSSLGASSFGANQPQATWIDYERWLWESGGLKYKSKYVTYGGEDDTGGGISEEGMNILHQAIVRNGVQIYIPSSLHSAIEQRVQIFENNRVSLLINVGGNQTSLGNCSHASSIPNGYHASLQSCLDDDRGVIMRMLERGVPVIHLLNIRSLAARYGIPLVPNGNYTSGEVYYFKRVKIIPVIIFCIIIMLSTLFIYRIYR